MQVTTNTTQYGLGGKLAIKIVAAIKVIYHTLTGNQQPVTRN